MSADLATLGLAVDSRPVAEASKDLDRISQAAAKAERAATSFGSRADTAARKAQAANDNLAKSGERVDGIYAKLTRTVMAFGGALLGAFSVRAITQMADTWSDLRARVGLAIRDMDGAAAVMDRLGDTARRTYSSLGLTVESFIANSTALRELGFTTQQQLDYTEALNNALVVSGARADRARSVQESLSRAMALGVLRGQELNNVIMNGGRVAEVLAEEMGTGVNQLRALGTEGKITGDIVYNALTRRLEELREEAESMPATIEDAFTLIGNATLQFIGSFDQATGASETLASALIVVADNVDRIITTAATAVTMYGTYYVAAFVAANLATMTLVGALRLLRTALIRTGIFAVIVAAGELVYWFTRLVQGAGGFGEAMSLLKNVAVAAFQEMDHAGEGLWHALQGVAWKIAEAFTNAFALVAENFGKLIDHLTGVGRINDLLEFTGASFRLPTAAGFAADGMRETARGFGQRGADAFARSAESFRGMEATKAAIDELREALANLDKDADGAAEAADRLNKALEDAASGGKAAADAAKKAAQEFEAFRQVADGLAEAMFPGEYAMREAIELMDLLDRFGDKLDDLQRKAVEARIDLMFDSAAAGVRDLSRETQKAGREMEQALQPVADLLFDLFSKPIKDMDDLLERVAQFGAGMARSNFQGIFGGFGMQADNDNSPEAYKKAVQQGAQAGSAVGIFTALTEMGMGSGAAGGLATAFSAGLGGFAMGYESGSPAMGALGGALQGFGAGQSLVAAVPALAGSLAIPIIGAVIGGIAGIIGAFAAKNQARRQAEAELDKHREAIQNLIDFGEGRGVGEFTQAWREFYTEIIEATELAFKGGDTELANRLHAAFNTFFLRIYEDYQRGFDGLIDSLVSGHGTSSPFMQANAEVLELRENLLGLVADAEEMNRKFMELAGVEDVDFYTDRAAEQIAAMTEAVQKAALATLTGEREFTAMEAAVQRVDGAAAALHTTLEMLGMSADEAAKAINQGVTVAMDRLRDQLNQSVMASISELSGAGFINEIVAAQSIYNERVRDFAALGMDASLATTELNLRLGEIAREANLTDDQLRQLAEAFPMLADGLLALIGGGTGSTAQALSDAQAAVARAEADLRQAYQAQASTIETLISRLGRAERGIKDFMSSLRLDRGLSPLGAFDRLTEAQRQFQEVAQLALEGDIDALEKIEGVSRQYLEEARAYHGTSENYFRIFEEVESLLDAALKVARDQISHEELQLQALKDLVSPLIDINDSVMTVAQAISALGSAIAARDAAQMAHNNHLTDLIAQMGQANQINPNVTKLYQDVLGRAPEAEGAAWWSSFLGNQALTPDIYKLFADAARQRGETPLPGFSQGGFTGMGALNQIMGVVHGQEFVAHAEATRRWRPQLEAMNNGTYGGGDSKEVVQALKQEIGSLKQEIRELRGDVRAGAGAQVAATTRVGDTIENGNRQADQRSRRVA